jgi:hypothetical protein
MQYGTYGIYEGGAVTLDNVQAGIRVAPAILKTQDGRKMGFGQDGRFVRVHFHQAVAGFAWESNRPTSFDAPVYSLELPDDAGFAYLAFDTVETTDVVIIGAPATGYVIFGKVSWPANANTIADLTLDFTERQESRVLDAYDPLNATELYDAGMRFGDAQFNGPLISFAVQSEVLQGEALAKNSDAFAYVVVKPTDVVNVNTTLTIEPIRVVLRKVVDDLPLFRAIRTKAPFVFTFDVTGIPGQRIYVWVDTTTGEVFADTLYTPAPDIGTVLVAYGDVPFGATTLADVHFILASEVAESSAQAGTSIVIQDLTKPAGFVKPFVATPSSTIQKALLLEDNVAVVRGVEYRCPQTQVLLPDAGLTVGRLDLVFAEFYRTVEPAPPTDGSFYLHVPGVGYVVARMRYTIAANVSYADANDLLLDAAVTAIGGGNFVRRPGGEFASPFLLAHETESYALPVALVYRYSQKPFAYDAIDGGGTGPGNVPTRPDGKRHNFLHRDELEVVAPVQMPANVPAVLGAALGAILKGQHPNKLGAAPQVVGYHSARPLQVDAIAPAAMGDAHVLSAPDGVRREWTADPQPYWLGTTFEADLDGVSTFHNYEDGAKALTLNAPQDARLYLGGVGGDQPVAALVWVDTGAPVVLTGPWAVGLDQKSASATLDTADANYDASGTVSLSFAVIQDAIHYPSETPAQLLLAKLNGSDYMLATPDPRPVALTSATATLEPVGGQNRGSALSIVVTVTGVGTSQVVVPAVIDSHLVLGVRSASKAADASPLGIKTVELGSPDLAVTFTSAIANGEDVNLELVLAGRFANVRPQNRHLGDFATAGFFTASIDGGQAVVRVALPHNHVLRSVLGFTHQAAGPLVYGVYVDGYLYPCTPSGFDRNLVTLALALSLADYATLPLAQQAKWTLDVGGTFYTLAAGTYQIALPLTWSDALATTDTFVVGYSYDGLPFSPAPVGETFEILARGYVLATDSSIANHGTHYTSPATERLPLVRGKVKGVGVSSPQTSMVDPLGVRLAGLIPFEGTTFAVDGGIDFGMGIPAPDAGVLAWIALVKWGRAARVFCYVTEGNAFAVEQPPQAFVSYPVANFVE